MTIGPEPKPIRTGATLHTVCVTHGPLSTYKLFARTYGGKGDEDINQHNKHTVTKLKMVSLYDFVLDPFRNNGHCVVMDSAYMSDAMSQVGREEWKINMVGTCQTDRCDAGPLGKIAYTGKDKKIAINSHESLLFQHKTKPLTYAVWGNNNFVKTPFNFHSPVILVGWMRRKRRNPQTKRRERGILVMSIVLHNKRPTARLIIRLIKEMELKPSMIYQLNLIYRDGDQS
jgi:hypothetical protein